MSELYEESQVIAIRVTFTLTLNLSRSSMSKQDTRTVVGKVELIFACALHTISIFFYLLIFNVRAPSCAIQQGLRYAWPDRILFVTCFPSASDT